MKANTQDPGDERLSALLNEWKAVEPQAGFEAEVWRRIRTASGAKQPRPRVVLVLREWVGPRLAWVNGLAAAAGIVVGIWLALSVSLPRGVHPPAGDVLLRADTLAGSYVTMVTGGTR